MSLEPYVYNAVVESVVDGDTIHASIDLGIGVWARGTDKSRWGMLIRFDGCNAAEHGTPGGDAATANLTALLPPGTPVTLRSVDWDKYGDRIDADVIELDGTDLIQQLIAEQWLAAWDGTGERPVPPWPRTVTTTREGHHER